MADKVNKINGGESMSLAEMAQAEVKAEAYKEVKEELKGLYRRERKAKIVLQNIRREIEDRLHKLEIENEDADLA